MDTGNIEVRRAAADDTQLLSVLAATTFYEAYFEQDTPEDLSRYIIDSFNTQCIRDQIGNEHVVFLIAFIDGRAVGYAKLDGSTTQTNIAKNGSVELKRLYTLERVWGKGVGKMLLQRCEEMASELGFETIWLGVWQQNERGRRFYAKHGFEKIGTIEFPYGNSVGVNDLLEKKLDS